METRVQVTCTPSEPALDKDSLTGYSCLSQEEGEMSFKRYDIHTSDDGRTATTRVSGCDGTYTLQARSRPGKTATEIALAVAGGKSRTGWHGRKVEVILDGKRV